ncbi:MAG TPA: hypothetical protein EYN67_14480 [Flavobacteriales bacterium]|nr:hypothetical protein [Flavobacteriales bacterium]
MDHRLTVSVDGVDHKMVPVFNPNTGEQGYTAEEYLDKDTSDLLVRDEDGQKMGYFGDGWAVGSPEVETEVEPSKAVFNRTEGAQVPVESVLTKEDQDSNTLRFIATATAAGWSLAKISQYLEGRGKHRESADVLTRRGVRKASTRGDYDERVDDLRKKYVVESKPLVDNTNKNSRGYGAVRTKYKAPGSQATSGQGTARGGVLHPQYNSAQGLNQGQGIDAGHPVVKEADKAFIRANRDLKFGIKPKGKLGILSKIIKALGSKF